MVYKKRKTIENEAESDNEEKVESTTATSKSKKRLKNKLDDGESGNKNSPTKEGKEEKVKMDYEQFIGNENYKLVELKEIATQLGVPNNFKKDELYERIKEFLLVKKSLLKEANEKESINSFNKTQIELTIKDIEPVEHFFWKIFRNKFIFNTIFSNFRFKKSHSYDMIYSVPFIYKNYSNSIEIIKDKVKSNSYLSFESGQYYRTINQSKNPLRIIFDKIVEKNEENERFYQNFFKNYIDSIRHNIITNLIQSSNIFALDLFDMDPADINGRVPEIKNYRGLKMFNYLLSNGWTNSNFFSISKEFNLYDDSFKLKHLIKLVNSLVEIKDLNDSTDLIKIKELSSLFQFSEKQLNSTIFELLDKTSSILINKPKENYKIKKEIDYNGILDKLQLNDVQKISIIQLLKEKDETIGNLLKELNGNGDDESIDHQVSQENINQDMEIETEDPNIKQIKLLILKYIDFLHSNTPMEPEMNYYLLFKSKDEIVNKINEVTIRDNGYNFDSPLLRESRKLFRFGKYASTQFELISNQFKSVSQKPHISSLFPQFIESIIENACIQCIDAVFKTISLEFYKDIEIVLKCIKSTDLLDFFFKKHQDLFFNHGNSHWLYITDLKIIEHYEKLMESLGRTFLLTDFDNSFLKPYYQNRNHSIKLDLVLRALNKPELYIAKDKLDFKKFEDSFLVYLGLNKQDTIIELLKKPVFKNINVDKVFTLNRFDFNNPFQTLKRHKLAQWIFNNLEKPVTELHTPNYLYKNSYCLSVRSGDQIIEIHCPINILIQLYMEYGLFEEIFKLPSFSFCTAVSSIEVHRVPLQFIDLLFKYATDHPNGDLESEQVRDIFIKLILDYANVPLLKHLTLNHSCSFFKKANKGIFNAIQIKKLLERSIRMESLELSELLINYNTCMTKQEFNGIATYDSPIYSKLINKFKK